MYVVGGRKIRENIKALFVGGRKIRVFYQVKYYYQIYVAVGYEYNCKIHEHLPIYIIYVQFNCDSKVRNSSNNSDIYLENYSPRIRILIPDVLVVSLPVFMSVQFTGFTGTVLTAASCLNAYKRRLLSE